MCQAIVKSAGLTIAKSKLKCAWDSNPHGAGFAYLSESRVRIEKGFFNFKSFWKAYRAVQHLDVLIHFRFATHGDQTPENCHPFELGEDSAIIHNGILDRFLPRGKDERSDTRVFVEDLLNPTLATVPHSTHAFLSDELTQRTLENLIGYSKLAALTPEGFALVNEELGTWDSKGVWWSAGIPRRWANQGLDFDFGCTDTEDRTYWNALAQEFRTPIQDDDWCELCDQPSSRLYQIGADMVCRDCWGEYI